MKTREFFNSVYWRGLCLLIALAILWTDSLTPLGFADGTLYLFPLLMAALTSSEAFLLSFAILSTLFTIVGFFTSPPGIALGYVLINRALSIIEVWLLCGTSIMVKRQLAHQIETTRKLLQSQSLVDEQRKRLAQSQRLEALGQLTGGVAHDFNNLLTVIMGNGELLADQMRAKGEYSQLIDQINQASARASQLTMHLLAFARRQALEPHATDVKKLLNGMESLLRRTLMENFEIELVHAGGLWPALVDSARLEGAVLNLCLNARDAMPNGGRLTIETCNASLDQEYADSHDEVHPGQYVMIGVTDSGVGMSQETLAHVFDPFFTTKGPGKGTGLGLSMVYGFVKQSRGHVKIYTEEGHGTTVRIYLPKAVEAKVQDKPNVTPQLHGRNEVILLVEDDEMVRMYAHHLLEDMGYQVLSASNGPQALELLAKAPDVRLLFTDVIMPGGMNGRQLADAACKLRPSLKVLYTSGYTENAIVHHGRLDPGVILLSKPYQRKDLVNKLRQVLGTDGN